MIRFICAATALMLAVSPVLAAKAPRLPPTARKLDANEVVALYDRKSLSFRNFTGKRIVTGTFTVNFARKSASGSFNDGKSSGYWTGKVRMSGSRFCRKIGKSREGCVALYVDGASIYEVNASGVVESLNARR